MPAKITVVSKTFDDKTTGQLIPYKRAVISGYVDGQLNELELSLIRLR